MSVNAYAIIRMLAINCYVRCLRHPGEFYNDGHSGTVFKRVAVNLLVFINCRRRHSTSKTSTHNYSNIAQGNGRASDCWASHRTIIFSFWILAKGERRMTQTETTAGTGEKRRMDHPDPPTIGWAACRGRGRSGGRVLSEAAPSRTWV